MLESLSINNVALIDSATIEFGDGLNALTGETGAGKSLIVDSLSLLLGEKADKSLISYGKTFASVEAVFSTNLPEVLDKLEEFGLERENTIVISRKLSANGKNECRVNGKTFTLSMLKNISAPLMDLHGQFQHQEILKEENQLETIDNFGGESLALLKEKYAEKYEKYKDIVSELGKYNFSSSDRERKIDMLKYQIDEIEQANFKEGEEEELREFRVKVLNQEKIAQSLSKLNDIFLEDGGIVSLIKKSDYEFGELLRYLPEQKELAERISASRYELTDIGDTIAEIADNLSFDENSALENEKRLDLLVSMKKKYGGTIKEINEFLESAKGEYEKLINSAEVVERLENEKNKTFLELVNCGKELSEARKKCAGDFEKLVISELSELSMKNSIFYVEFQPFDESLFDATGFDRIEFMFSANIGQVARPLNKVVSGGEMSRFMLAVKNITADIDKVDTMIFDEIDSGISGETANVLAKKLAKIGKNHQVICVTHLAQVACFGKIHYLVSKSIDDGKTKTSIKLLSGEDRVKEIARFFGGEISEYSLSHAREMIDSAKKYI